MRPLASVWVKFAVIVCTAERCALRRARSGDGAAALAGAAAIKAAGTRARAKVTGTVLDTFDAAGYTYLQLQTASGDQWAAVRQTPVKKGQVVTMDVQMTAEKFESKTLNRTFDSFTVVRRFCGSIAVQP